MTRSSATAEGQHDMLFVLFHKVWELEVSNSKSDIQDHSRALATVSFDRPHTISYVDIITYFPQFKDIV